VTFNIIELVLLYFPTHLRFCLKR